MTRRRVRLGWVVLCAALLIPFAMIAAQETTAVYQAFVAQGANGAPDRLTFVDLVAGAQTTFDVDGERYALIEDGVIFFDQSVRRVRTAAPGGTLRDHPFVQLEGDARRVDWLIGRDQVVWTLTSGAAPNLLTVTYAANPDGTNRREVFADSNGAGVRAFPLALDETTIYMDYQPDSIGDITPFRQFAGLFSLDLTTGDTAMLPREPGCFCGAAVGAGRLLRLTLAANFGGFDVRVVDLATGAERSISSVGAYTQGGDALIAADGRYAAYALGEIRDLGLPTQQLRTVIVVVDLAAMTQRVLLTAERQLRPIQFTEGTLLLVDPQANTTLKADLASGAVDTVAQGLYLGTVQNR